MTAFQTDRAYLDVTVNDVPMNIGADCLDFCHVIENAHSNKPSVSLRFVDNKNAAQTWGTFQDGATVKVTMGDGHNQPTTYEFAQYGVEEIAPKMAGDLIELSGVANVVPWFTSVVTKPQKGNASDAVQQQAQQAGITNTDIDSTQDNQTWHPDNRTMAQWARKVIDHAWMGDGKSPFMTLGFDADGSPLLRIKDILSQGSATKTMSSAGLDSAGDLLVWDHRIKTQGGAMGSVANYGMKTITPDLAGDIDKFFQMDLTALLGFLGISSKLSSSVQNARTNYRPASHGNTHDMYHQAEHNNTKSRALYSTIVRTLLWEQSGLRMQDDVMANLANSMGQQDPAFSGQYKVTAITRSILRGSYLELLTNSSTGQNSQGGSSGSGAGAQS